ncbi:hypothetical protein E2320_010537 [Naja naja]|nr:hypothetical protein E2320_010537 [Naja naja]
MAGAPVEVASLLRPGRCAYFVERKKRFCKMVPAQGRHFCGEHSAEEEEHKRKRIPCPLDPKHTVYEDQLQKHLKKCNSREKPKPVYFAKDINAGLKNETELPEEQSRWVSVNKVRNILCPFQQAPISALSKQELDNLIRKLKKASNTINYELKDQILSHQALQEALNDPQNGDAAFKHLKQQASILGNMKRLHLLGPGNCFVEFGAGRGKLSHWLDIALQDAQDVHFLLVERASTRFKVDGKHRKRYFERLQVDIQHLCLSKVPLLMEENLSLIGIGKHLCGAATDLALRCLVDTYVNSRAEEKEGPVTKRIKTDCPGQKHSKRAAENWSPIAGIVIALCCHHRCELLTVDERKQIGHLCKLLIDHGRIEYLQRRGYEAELQRYTDSSVSLENVLLTAVPSHSSLSSITT